MRVFIGKSRGFSLPEMLTALIIGTMIFTVIIRIMIATANSWHRASSLNQAFPPAYSLLSQMNYDLLNAAYVKLPPMWTSGTAYTVGNPIMYCFQVTDPQDAQHRTMNVYQPFICAAANTASTSNQPIQNTNTSYWTQSYPWIIIYQPILDSNNLPVIPIDESPNGVVEYYLSDSTGTRGHTGTYLWRVIFNQSGTNATVVSTHVMAKNVSSVWFYSASTANQVLSIDSMAVSFLGTQGSSSSTSTFRCGIAIRNPAPATIPSMPTFP